MSDLACFCDEACDIKPFATIFLAIVRLWVKVREGAVIAYRTCYARRGTIIVYSTNHYKKTECSLLMTWWKHGGKSDGGGGAIHDQS